MHFPGTPKKCIYKKRIVPIAELFTVSKETKAEKLGRSMKHDGNLHQAMVINKSTEDDASLPEVDVAGC